jgi:hypothetical protein
MSVPSIQPKEHAHANRSIAFCFMRIVFRGNSGRRAALRFRHGRRFQRQVRYLLLCEALESDLLQTALTLV